MVTKMLRDGDANFVLLTRSPRALLNVDWNAALKIFGILMISDVRMSDVGGFYVCVVMSFSLIFDT